MKGVKCTVGPEGEACSNQVSLNLKAFGREALLFPKNGFAPVKKDRSNVYHERRTWLSHNSVTIVMGV